MIFFLTADLTKPKEKKQLKTIIKMFSPRGNIGLKKIDNKKREFYLPTDLS